MTGSKGSATRPARRSPRPASPPTPPPPPPTSGAPCCSAPPAPQAPSAAGRQVATTPRTQHRRRRRLPRPPSRRGVNFARPGRRGPTGAPRTLLWRRSRQATLARKHTRSRFTSTCPLGTAPSRPASAGGTSVGGKLRRERDRATVRRLRIHREALRLQCAALRTEIASRDGPIEEQCSLLGRARQELAELRPKPATAPPPELGRLDPAHLPALPAGWWWQRGVGGKWFVWDAPKHAAGMLEPWGVQWRAMTAAEDHEGERCGSSSPRSPPASG